MYRLIMFVLLIRYTREVKLSAIFYRRIRRGSFPYLCIGEYHGADLNYSPLCVSNLFSCSLQAWLSYCLIHIDFFNSFLVYLSRNSWIRIIQLFWMSLTIQTMFQMWFQRCNRSWLLLTITLFFYNYFKLCIYPRAG